MKWFDDWFAKKSKQAWDNAQKQQYASPINVLRTHEGLNSNGLNLTLYKADGGTVVEFRHYDPISDRNKNSLHVITDQEDMAERLSQIITMEIIKYGTH